MFKKASKLKLRFPSALGSITVEDLWDLPLTGKNVASLNEVAKTINADLKTSEEEDFVATKTSSDSVLELKLEIVKDIIASRLEANAKAASVLESKAQKEKIMSIMANKQDAAMEGKSLAQLQKMLDAL